MFPDGCHCHPTDKVGYSTGSKRDRFVRSTFLSTERFLEDEIALEKINGAADRFLGPDRLKRLGLDLAADIMICAQWRQLSRSESRRFGQSDKEIELEVSVCPTELYTRFRDQLLAQPRPRKPDSGGDGEDSVDWFHLILMAIFLLMFLMMILMLMVPKRW